jgi:hypothetical protein
VGEKRFSPDLDEKLRDFFRDRTQAGGESAGEQGDGKLSDGRGGHGWIKKLKVKIRQFAGEAGRGKCGPKRRRR